MSPKIRHPSIIVVLLALSSAPLGATDWMYYYRLRSGTVDGVKPGGMIVLKTTEGGQFKGQLVERSGGAITLLDQDGVERSFEWSELRWARCKNKGLGDLIPGLLTRSLRSRGSTAEDASGE